MTQLLVTFVCVADCGSFNRAAEKLYISPPSVMKQINTLERRLGTEAAGTYQSGHPADTGGAGHLSACEIPVYLCGECAAGGETGPAAGKCGVFDWKLATESLQALYGPVVSGEPVFPGV